MNRMGGILLLVVLLTGLGLAGFWHFSSVRADAGLAGISTINRSDLPQDWQGLSDADLLGEVDEMLASGLGDGGKWWGGPFDEDQSRQFRMAALILEDRQLGVRSLCWLAHRLQYDSKQVLAIEYLDVAIEEAQQAGLTGELARCHYQRGNCLEWLGLYESALQGYAKALEVSRQAGDPEQESYYLVQLATLNDNRLGRCETAIELYAQLPSYAEEGVEPRSMVPKYNLWGLSLQSAGRYEDSLEPFNLALAAAEESGEVDKVQSTLQLLAQSQLALNHYAEAGELLQRAIELEGPDVLITDRLAPQRTLAGLYMLTDRNTEALSLLQDAIGGIEEIETSALGEELKAYSLDEMRTQKVLTLAMQADMLIQMGNPQQALEYLLQTDVLNKGVKWLLPYEDMTLPLAQAYLELGRWQDAEARLEMNTDNEALELLPDLGQNNPDLLRLRGEIELARGNLQQAGDYLQSALEACSPVSNELPLMPKAAILRDMGRLAELSGDLTGAEEKYRLAMDELLAIASAVPWNTLLTGGLAEEIYDAGQSLIELYESQGRTQEADEVRNTLDQVKTAAQFIRNYSSISNDDADAAFRQYRTINTHLETLRYKLHYDLGAGVDNFDQKYEQLQDAQGLPRKYRKEQLEQISTLRQELEEKVIGLEQEAAAKLAELRELDPEAAAIIELK